MLRSSNPILSKQDAFTPAAPQYNQNPYGQPQAGYPQYPGSPQAPVEAPEGRMTFDDVVTKTAAHHGRAGDCSGAGVDVRTGRAVLSGADRLRADRLHRRHVRRVPAEGLARSGAALRRHRGHLHRHDQQDLRESTTDGIVVQAVIGTFAAAAVTLAAYKFFNIRVTPKFRKVVIIATIAFAVALLINFVLVTVRRQPGIA